MSRTKRIRYLRQVEDITALLESDAFRAHGLAEKLGISIRSAHRLLNDLRAVGVPIQTNRHGLQLWYYMGKRPAAQEPAPETPAQPDPPPDATPPEVVAPEPAQEPPAPYSDWDY
jgi:biotin operon repressor